MTPIERSLLLLGAAALSACSQREAATPRRTPTAVRVRAVEKAAAATSARYSANIEPDTKVDVAFKVSGYVKTLAQKPGVGGKPRALQEGDAVTRGEVLLALDPTDYAQRLREAKAQLGEAQANEEQARLNFERARKMVVGQTITEAQFDQARVAQDAAAARAAGAKARVDEAQTANDDCTLRSPLEGLVLHRNVEVGTLAAPGTVAVSVADTRNVKVVFGVPDTVLETMKLGAPLSVTTSAFAGVRFRGHITRIAPFADPKSRVFEVETTIPNPKGELRAGMVAALDLAEGLSPTAAQAFLPLTAIVRSRKAQGGFAVYVVEEAQGTQTVARLRDVELGELLGNLIPVLKGVQDQERVVVMGATLLADGEPVQVIP